MRKQLFSAYGGRDKVVLAAGPPNNKGERYDNDIEYKTLDVNDKKKRIASAYPGTNKKSQHNRYILNKYFSSDAGLVRIRKSDKGPIVLKEQRSRSKNQDLEGDRSNKHQDIRKLYTEPGKYISCLKLWSRY